LWIAKRVKKIISVEHSRQWWKKVVQTAQKRGITNYKCLLIKPELVPRKNLPERASWDPEFYMGRVSGSGGRKLRAKGLCAVFEKYAKVIDKYPDGTFDLVFVDGRARNSCMLHARAKIRPGGFLMLDDAQRGHYKRNKVLLADWKCKDFYGVGKQRKKPWSTMIWKKP